MKSIKRDILKGNVLEIIKSIPAICLDERILDIKPLFTLGRKGIVFI